MWNATTKVGGGKCRAENGHIYVVAKYEIRGNYVNSDGNYGDNIPGVEPSCKDFYFYMQNFFS